MSFLSMLLGQQAGVGAVEGGLEYDENGNLVGITTSGANTSPPVPTTSDKYENFSLRNVDAIRERDAALKDGEEAANRKGMFGVKGTLRDILGTVGDAFLVQGGGDAIYAPTREKEKFADAMAGFSVDPVGASERGVGVNPAAGMKFYEGYQDSEAAAMQNRIRQEELRRGMSKDRLDALDGARDQIARWLGATQNDQQRAYVLGELAPKYLAGRGLTMEDLQLQPGMTGEEAGIVAAGDMRVNQQRQLPIAQQRADAATRNAQSSAIRAARAPQPRAPRAETDAERAVRIGNKPASQRSEGENIFLKRYQQGTGGSSILETFRQNQQNGAAPASRFRPAGRQQ